MSCECEGYKKGPCTCEEGAKPSPVSDGYDLSHPNTMIVINNFAEQSYLVAWCEERNRLPPYLGRREKYPVAMSPNGGGWTDHMDRALYYVPFEEFVARS